MDEQRRRGMAAGSSEEQKAVAACPGRSPSRPRLQRRLRPNTGAGGQPRGPASARREERPQRLGREGHPAAGQEFARGTARHQADRLGHRPHPGIHMRLLWRELARIAGDRRELGVEVARDVHHQRPLAATSIMPALFGHARWSHQPLSDRGTGYARPVSIMPVLSPSREDGSGLPASSTRLCWQAQAGAENKLSERKYHRPYRRNASFTRLVRRGDTAATERSSASRRAES
jgi:hypothetical protein